MELSLACHAAYLPEGVQFFILQNCRGSYDAARTLAVARRYEYLFPRAFTVVDDLPPGPAYRSIAALLASPRFAEIDLICKVDDDAFPIAHGWFAARMECWKAAAADSNRPLAYVTPLINNNTWGFRETLDTEKGRLAQLLTCYCRLLFVGISVLCVMLIVVIAGRVDIQLAKVHLVEDDPDDLVGGRTELAKRLLNDIEARRTPIHHQDEGIDQRRYGTRIGNGPDRWQIDNHLVEPMTRRRQYRLHALRGEQVAGIRNPPP
jgi:hypothetical protein